MRKKYKTKMIMLRLTPLEYDYLVTQAESEELSMSELVRIALREYGKRSR